MKGEGAHTVDMAIVRHRFCMNTGDFADMIRVYIYTNAEIENIIEIERVSPLGMFQQVGQASGAGGADKSNVAITWSSKRKSVFWGGAENENLLQARLERVQHPNLSMGDSDLKSSRTTYYVILPSLYEKILLGYEFRSTI